MPDLLTHLAVQTAINQLPKINRYAVYTLIGAVVPDLSRVITRFANPVEKWWGYPLHSPLFLLVLFYAMSLLFVEKERPRLVLWCWVGSLIHISMDILQDNVVSYYMLLFPFSIEGTSFNWIHPEASLSFLPLTVTIAFIAIIIRKLLIARS